MGMIIISSLASKVGKNVWYGLNMSSGENLPGHRGKSEYGNVLESTRNEITVNEYGWSDKHLRAFPLEDGYKNLLTDELPRNNIVLMATVDGESYNIEFADAKCKVVKENTIKETAIVNRRGTVKEYICASDYTVTISGNLFVKSRNDFPFEALELLNRLLNTTERMPVASVYLSFFGINYLVFKTGTFDQQTAKYVNVMPFSLTFASDENYNFLVEDNN